MSDRWKNKMEKIKTKKLLIDNIAIYTDDHCQHKNT